MQREGLLKGSGTTVRFALNQLDVAKVTYDGAAANGIAVERDKDRKNSEQPSSGGQS
jgi:hypothetical protein